MHNDWSLSYYGEDMPDYKWRKIMWSFGISLCLVLINALFWGVSGAKFVESPWGWVGLSISLSWPFLYLITFWSNSSLLRNIPILLASVPMYMLIILPYLGQEKSYFWAIYLCTALGIFLAVAIRVLVLRLAEYKISFE